MCVFSYAHPISWFCDIDFEPMTLIYERDLDIPKTYLHNKNEVSRSRTNRTDT